MAKTASKASPAAKTISFESLAADIRKGLAALAPVYLIHGEEGFYADRLYPMFEALIPEADRDFNLLTVYAPETPMASVHEACRRFPMMAERQLVIVKECQSCPARDLDKLAPYLQNPSPHTVLVLIYRGEKAKGREITAAVKKCGGVVFEGTRLKDWQARSVVSGMVKDAGLNIEERGLDMLADHLGTDLARIYNEIEKLRICLPAGGMVTPEAVERHVGISREFNNFELINAIAAGDSGRTLRILNHFAADPRHNPFPVILSLIFTLFSNILIYHFSPDKSSAGIAAATNIHYRSGQDELVRAAARYNAHRALAVVGAIRRADARSKGVGSRQDPYDLLRDLLFTIFH